jgi:hypothetical protein
MNKIAVVVFTLLFFVLVSGSVRADYMRCGRDLVSEGDHQGEVLAACGEPLLSSQRRVYRSGIPARRFRSLSAANLGNRYFSDFTSRELAYHNRSVVEVPVDVWTYNFGPRHFMREVTFVDGQVDTIRTLGYGH